MASHAPAKGIHDHDTRKLGRRPPSNAPRLHAAQFFNAAVVPAHDPADDNLLGFPFQMYGNDHYGDCGPTSVGNNVISVSHGSDEPSQDDVFDLYRRSGNPNFPSDDNGVVMQDMLDALLTGGIGGRKPIAFAAVDPHDDAMMEAAVFTFDGILLGVDLEVAQQSQQSVWDYKRSGEWGGHAIFCGKYVASTGRLTVISWAEHIETTLAFRQHQLDEAWVVVWPEHLSRPGVDANALAAAYKQLTGKTLPLPSPAPTPTPAPTGGPDYAGAASKLWTATEHWAVGERHTGDNKKAATAVRDFAAEVGLYKP